MLQTTMPPNAIHTIKTHIEILGNQITNQKHVLLVDPEVDSESTDHRRGKEEGKPELKPM